MRVYIFWKRNVNKAPCAPALTVSGECRPPAQATVDSIFHLDAGHFHDLHPFLNLALDPPVELSWRVANGLDSSLGESHLCFGELQHSHENAVEPIDGVARCRAVSRAEALRP